METKNNRKSRLPTKSKPTEGILWSTTDRLQLLAYLNWCVKYCVNFKATAPGYLKKATGKHFSKERIRKKLCREWQYYGKCHKFNDIFELGTSAFSPLLGNEQECLHQMITSINPTNEARCIQRRSLGPAPESRPLSAPRSVYPITSSREPNELSTPQPGKSNLVPERLRQKTKAEPSLRPTRLASNNDLSEDELASDDNTDRIQNEDESELSTIASPELTDIAMELAPTMCDSQEHPMAVISQGRLNSSLRTSIESISKLKVDGTRSNDLMLFP
ncbi:hypothetical protein Forpi1262_v001872 [Fusarium oxysporum f. sp. raphani]|uniref:Uncharacterized protein n=1 Tax=Fusarium oxysporum f. sp. raphani TaxID=96318 RepID=A0A8J5QAF4_FUSOX|nr:hypothetical protein Forpi1262_v001872 [Fusarium oxysporum f. sp. raphani]